MTGILLIILLIIAIIVFTLNYFKKEKINEINQQVKDENEKLLRDKELIENEIKILQNKENEINDRLARAKDMAKDMNAAARDAFGEYSDSLEASYNQQEQDYQKLTENLVAAYETKQDELRYEYNKAKADLTKITKTRAAALEAQRKEEEIKNQQAFYCPQVPEEDLRDAKTLKDIEYKLNNPRILRMLIWSTYYQKPMNQVCANVLGGASVVKTGIYKITNQTNGICYIGQAVNLAQRWKDHAKYGLGIDTPANNRMYKAMQQDGLENFSFEVLEECAAADLNEKERFYINLYQADQFGYNGNKGIQN